jgi:hypothetical protein
VVRIGQYDEPYCNLMVVEKNTLSFCFSKNMKVRIFAILQERVEVSVSRILTL